MVFSLEVLYTEDRREIFLDDFWTIFSLRTTTRSVYLTYFNFIGAIVCCAIELMPSALGAEETCMEAKHACMLVENSGAPRWSVLTNLCLVMFLYGTLKFSLTYTKIYFMWWGENTFFPYFSIHYTLSLLQHDFSFALGPLSLGWSLPESPEFSTRYVNGLYKNSTATMEYCWIYDSLPTV